MLQIKPEKLVEQEIRLWCNQNRFWVSVIDSKATYSEKAKSYRKSNTAPEGFPDLVGSCPDGTLCMIELKAKGKLRTVRQSQVFFLHRAIEHNAFAVVVDSSTLLEGLWKGWLASHRSQEFLLQHLKGCLEK